MQLAAIYFKNNKASVLSVEKDATNLRIADAFLCSNLILSNAVDH